MSEGLGGRLVKTTVMITEEQREFLRGNPSVNLSGIVREALEQYAVRSKGVIGSDEFEIAKKTVPGKILNVLSREPDNAFSVPEILKRVGLKHTMGNMFTVNASLFGLQALGKVELGIHESQPYYRCRKPKVKKA